MKTLFLLPALLCFASNLAPACDEQLRALRTNTARLIQGAQNQVGNPIGLWVQRPIQNEGEIPWLAVGDWYTLTKTYDRSFLNPGPLSLPVFNFGRGSFFARSLGKVFDNQIAQYAEDKDVDIEAIRAIYQEELSNPSSRQLLFLSRNLVHPEEAGIYAAHLRVFDGTETGRERPKFPLERYLGVHFPPGDGGRIEIGIGFKHPDQLLKDALGFKFILREVGTYLDTAYHARQRSSEVFLMTTPKGRRLFTSAEYGFQDYQSVERNGKRYWILRLGGNEFVERHGSSATPFVWGLSQHDDSYFSVRDPLGNPSGFREAVARQMAVEAQGYEAYHLALRQLAGEDMGLDKIALTFAAALRMNPQALEALGGVIHSDEASRLGQNNGLPVHRSLPVYLDLESFVSRKFNFLTQFLF